MTGQQMIGSGRYDWVLFIEVSTRGKFPPLFSTFDNMQLVCNMWLCIVTTEALAVISEIHVVLQNLSS